MYGATLVPLYKMFVAELSMILLWFPIYVERNRWDCIYLFKTI